MAFLAALPAIAQVGAAAYGAYDQHRQAKKGNMGGPQGQLKKVDVLNKQQRGFLKDLFQNLSGSQMNIGGSPTFQAGESYLQNLLSGSPEAMKSFEQPAMTQFEQEIMPNLSEQFAGVGGLSSSGFQNSANAAKMNLAERLQAMRSGLQMQALPQALQYGQMPVENAYRMAHLGLGTPAFGYQNRPGQPGMMAGLGAGLGQNAPGIFGQLRQMFGGMGGGAGAPAAGAFPQRQMGFGAVNNL